MSEWWTYTLQDFLMFSSRTYFRMFELYNAAIWPAQIAAALVGLAVLVLLLRPTAAAGRVISAVLASSWLWIAIAFHIQRYAAIFSAARYVGAAFVLEALLFFVEGVLAGRLAFASASASGAARRAGLAIFVFALAVQPLLGPVFGRAWRQIQVFGVTPDPTAVATLGVLVLLAGRRHWELWIVPVLWCALSAATLAAMKAPEAWILSGAAVLAAVLAFSQSLRRRQEQPAALRNV